MYDIVWYLVLIFNTSSVVMPEPYRHRETCINAGEQAAGPDETRTYICLMAPGEFHALETPEEE